MTTALHHIIFKRPDPLVPGLLVPNLTLYQADGSEKDYLYINGFAVSRSGRSITTLLKVSRVMGLFWDYLVQVEGLFALGDPALRRSQILSGFVNGLARGTFIKSGNTGFEDRTGLFWRPLSPDVVRGLAHGFDVFINYMVNIFTESDPFHSRCQGIFSEAIPVSKGGRIPAGFGLLSHLSTTDSRDEPDTVLEHILAPDGRLSYFESPTKTFPREYVSPFLTEGYAKRTDVTDTLKDVDVTGRLYARLLSATGMRGCEPFHMFEEDFMLSGGRVVAYVRHPEQFRDPRRGGRTRVDVLREDYLMVPRTQATDRYKAGWKNLLMDRNNQAKVRWLPGSEDGVFMALSDYVLNVRTPIMRARRAKGLPDHPFLLICVRRNPSTKTEAGDPWTVPAAISSFKRAVGRLGKKKPAEAIEYRRENGMTRHALRHRYGKTLDDAGLSSKEIMIAMRHRSVLSSLVYRVPDDKEVSEKFDEAAQKIKDGKLDPYAGRHLTESEALEQLVHIAYRGGRWR